LAHDPAVARTVEMVMQTLGSLAETIQQAPSSTIEPVVGADTAGRHALETLRKLQGADAERLRPGATLGQGGMGIVKLAEQVALGRDVAVKTLKPEHASDAATLSLLREAWVTGSLEHPNIVPIYDVGLDEMGRPEIVLKRIEGEHWGDLMFDAAQVKARHGADDLLEWNLLVFRQITRAVHFAHSRGIVHRDLKPENVMVGSFGEVYVVDWGIALSLQDDGSGRYRLAKDATEMAGTPCYMAPEMLGGGQSKISERTDVYLLGAMLFELTEGRPPHEGENLPEILGSILATPPATEKAPEELARILRRALDSDPDARFETAEQLGLAVEGYLRHRGSRRLEQLARVRLEKLEAAVRAQGGECSDEEQLYGLYTECRFGFREALASWPENDRAREGSERATRLMIELELSHGDGEAADRLLVDLAEPDAELASRVEAARAENAAQKARLEALDAELDMSTGQRTRMFLAVIMGVVWTLAPLAQAYFPPEALYGPVGASFSISLLVLSFGVGYWARESMSRTLPNRRIFMALVMTLIGDMVLAIGCATAGIPPLVFEALMLFSWAVVGTMLVITVDKRLWPSPAAFIICFFLGTAWPEYVHYFMSAGNLVLTIVAVLVWKPGTVAEIFAPRVQAE